MVDLLDKMGTAIESMEGDIREMNDFLKAISLTQIESNLSKTIAAATTAPYQSTAGVMMSAQAPGSELSSLSSNQ